MPSLAFTAPFSRVTLRGVVPTRDFRQIIRDITGIFLVGHVIEASRPTTSGKRKCFLKRCMHCTHGSHALESVSSASLLPLPPSTYLAPCHLPRTSPPPSPNATSTPQRHFSLLAPASSTLASTPPLTQFLYHLTAATPQEVTVRNPDVMQSIKQNKRMTRVRRKKSRRRPDAASVSIPTHKKRKTNARHSAWHYIPSVTPRRANPLHTPRNFVRPARDSRSATPLVIPAS